jgi:hypothetical protein
LICLNYPTECVHDENKNIVDLHGSTALAHLLNDYFRFWSDYCIGPRHFLELLDDQLRDLPAILYPQLVPKFGDGGDDDLMCQPLSH